ncbi:hypothetical protein E3Z29_06675 [Pseudomonas sp. S150]|nr:hypothetical protein E3Z29_06675 [Pseudomonas sp. S150]
MIGATSATLAARGGCEGDFGRLGAGVCRGAADIAVEILFRPVNAPKDCANPVGASLLAKTFSQPTSLLPVIAHSRAGSLPQVRCFYATTASAGETILVFIPRERPELR